jgi:hypothetical protein
MIISSVSIVLTSFMYNTHTFKILVHWHRFKKKDSSRLVNMQRLNVAQNPDSISINK